MARGRGGGRGKSGSSSKYIKKVDWHKLLVKSVLRSYSSESGDMMFTDNASARKFFTLEKTREFIDATTSELVRRPGMGVNLAACNVDNGLTKLADLTGEKKKVLRAFNEWLEGDGKELRLAIAYLNKANEVDRSADETKKHMHTFVELLGCREDASARMQTYAELADIGAGIWAMCITLLEATTLCTKLKNWAKDIPELDKQSKEIRSFVDDPSMKRLSRA